MKIRSNSVVTINYKLYTAAGKLMEDAPEPIVYLHGGHHGIFPKIEETLTGKTVGDVFSVTLEPDDAFGEYDADLIRMESQDRFPDDVNVGMQFEGAAGDEGDDAENIIFTVTEIANGKVVIDGNHPLAGQTLRFDGAVVDVRQATAEELKHGHAHGPHGHHHH